jgi:hypothetical protein
MLWLSHGLALGFAGLFLLILGCALLTPPAVVALARLNQPLTARWACWREWRTAMSPVISAAPGLQSRR